MRLDYRLCDAYSLAHTLCRALHPSLLPLPSADLLRLLHEQPCPPHTAAAVAIATAIAPTRAGRGWHWQQLLARLGVAPVAPAEHGWDAPVPAADANGTLEAPLLEALLSKDFKKRPRYALRPIQA